MESSRSPRPGARPSRANGPRTGPPAARRSGAPRWLRTFSARLGSLASKPATRAGLAGLALLFAGLSGNLMARTPAYYNIDETAHVGYLSSLASGRLPHIEQRATVKVADPALASRLQVAPKTLKTIWVANHPPGAYLPAVPLVWATNALGIESALPVLLRLTGILFGIACVGFTYLMGCELSNGNERAGLLAAALTACVPHLAYVSGTGLTDAAALAGSLAVTWMAIRMVRLGFTSHRTSWLAAFVTLAAGTRLTSAVLAVATIAVLVLLAPGARVRFAAIAALPAVALTGWFYLRIHRLYGDVAASEYLLGRFDLADSKSISSVLLDVGGWDRILHGLAMSAPPYRYSLSPFWYRILNLAVVSSLVAIVATPFARFLNRKPVESIDLRRLDDRGTGRAGICAGLVVTVSMVLPFFFMAQHMAGGGGKHSRYLIAVVPPLACVVARAVWLMTPKVGRIAAVAAVGAAGALQVQVLRRYETPQFFLSAPALWTDPLLPSTVATVAATSAIVGFVLVQWSLIVPPDTRLLDGTGGSERTSGTGSRRGRAQPKRTPSGQTRPPTEPRRGPSRPVSR